MYIVYVCSQWSAPLCAVFEDMIPLQDDSYDVPTISFLSESANTVHSIKEANRIDIRQQT